VRILTSKLDSLLRPTLPRGRKGVAAPGTGAFFAACRNGSAVLTFCGHSPTELRRAMSATIISLVVVVAAMVVAVINGGPAPLEDDEATWP